MAAAPKILAEHGCIVRDVTHTRVATLLLQLFEGNNKLLPSLDAVAWVLPADGDDWCVLHSMLFSQGYPDDDAVITTYLENAQDKCHQFLSEMVSSVSDCPVQ